jgi:hypothetical protein
VDGWMERPERMKQFSNELVALLFSLWFFCLKTLGVLVCSRRAHCNSPWVIQKLRSGLAGLSVYYYYYTQDDDE